MYNVNRDIYLVLQYSIEGDREKQQRKSTIHAVKVSEGGSRMTRQKKNGGKEDTKSQMKYYKAALI